MNHFIIIHTSVTSIVLEEHISNYNIHNMLHVHINMCLQDLIMIAVGFLIQSAVIIVSQLLVLLFEY